MHLNDIIEFCNSLPHVEEKMPFGEDDLVYTIGGKMFILIDLEDFSMINIKCHPENAIELREKYSDVIPGYHMNKKHWNSILFPNDIPDKMIFQWIKNSYDLVYQTLTKKVKERLR